MKNLERKLENFPTILIIFGATGDLMERKLLPSVFHMHKSGFLPNLFQVIGFAKENFTEEEYRDWLRKSLPKKSSKVGDFLQKFSYQPGFFDNIDSYTDLGRRLGQVDGKFRTCTNKLFYLAVPPNYYEIIFKNLAKSGLTKPCGPKEGWTRVLVEKPFGQDLKRAQKLDKLLGKLFREIQIFRIDHYLAKETVLNLLVFRFGNSVFENLWNKDFIERIDIRLLQKEGVERRGLFYDSLGTLRDVGQNHLLQMLAFVTMDIPSGLEPEMIREKKLEILKSLSKMTKKEIMRSTVRGQYQDYRKISGVRTNSQKETYFKIKTFLNHPRWRGVPIILESGKKLNKDLAEIAITFRQTTPCLFCKSSEVEHHRNTLLFRIHPKEGISFCFFAKKPGHGMETEKRDLHFFYQEFYRKERILPDYERLLTDAFLGDQTLFMSTKEILASWKFVDPILKCWQKGFSPLKVYKQNSSGPRNNL